MNSLLVERTPVRAAQTSLENGASPGLPLSPHASRWLQRKRRRRGKVSGKETVLTSFAPERLFWEPLDAGTPFGKYNQMARPSGRFWCVPLVRMSACASDRVCDLRALSSRHTWMWFSQTGAVCFTVSVGADVRGRAERDWLGSSSLLLKTINCSQQPLYHLPL